MVVAMSVNAALVAVAAATTWLLPSRAALQVSPGQGAAGRRPSPARGAAAGQAPALSHAISPAREHVSAAD
jgi:hypothetical protein